jgi:hypothetical protein
MGPRVGADKSTWATTTRRDRGHRASAASTQDSDKTKGRSECVHRFQG